MSEKMISKTRYYNCVLQSSTQEYPKETVYRYCKKLKKNVDDETNNKLVYKISLIMHCIQNETKFMLDKEHNVGVLDSHIRKIKKYVKTLPKGYKFQKICEHPNIPLIGEYDILTATNKVIELKFVKSVGILHVLQTLMYYNNLFPNWKEDMRLEIWNLYSGKKYKITLAKKYTNYDFLKYVCDALKIKMVNNVFVYDLETDGTEYVNPEIIERHFQELYLNFVPSSGLVKAEKKLKSFITKLTGITNRMVERGDDKSKLKNDMDMIYKYCHKPTFVAHNGNSFDHRIMLQKGLLNDEATGKFLDSKSLIAMIYDDDNLHKKKLGELYQIVTGKDLTTVSSTLNAHRAEFDVLLLVGIFKALRLKLCDFI
jgi:DNA polymerase III epsilon subunit-like protein